MPTNLNGPAAQMHVSRRRDAPVADAAVAVAPSHAQRQLMAADVTTPKSREGAPLNSSGEERPPASVCTLPSTVPESLHDLPPALQSHQPVPATGSPNAATQELAESEVDSIIAKSRSCIDIVDELTTQVTLHAGEPFHVNLTSSSVLVPNGDGDDDDDDDDPLPLMSQYPESQRFKTPTTAGKKRDYLGNSLPTPDLPRPDLRFGHATPAHVIRLSQAFEATQAHTSPVTDGIALPLSDRPSPAADIEIRPAATTSPAMRPIMEPTSSYERASSGLSSSSPVPSKRRRTPSQALPPPKSSADLDESEAETYQADDNEHDGERPRPAVDMEDKENDERMAVQIPETVKKAEHSYRQPEQTSRTHGDIDRVPQSQTDLPAQQQYVDLQEGGEDKSPDAQSQLSDRSHLDDDLIPESSSSKQPPKLLPRSSTTGRLEAAQSCLPPDSSPNSHIPDTSSQSIIRPARERLRMNDISAATHSQLSSCSFDAVSALKLDTLPQMDLSQDAIVASITPPNVVDTRSSESPCRAPVSLPQQESTPSSPTPNAGPGTGLRRPNRSTIKKSRPNTWDLQKSPERPASELRGLVRQSRRISAVKDVQKSQIQDAPPPPPPPPPSLARSKTPPVDGLAAPDMVFAFFNARQRGYYPARCLQRITIEGGGVRYRVQWDGSDADEVDEYGIGALDLRVGDQVKIYMSPPRRGVHVVCGFQDKVDTTQTGDEVLTDIRGFRTVLVSRKPRKSLPVDASTESMEAVPIAHVYLDSNTWSQLKDRPREIRPLSKQPVVSSSGSSTPAAVAGHHDSSTPSSRTRGLPAKPAARGIFANMVFAISYDDSSMKDTITRAIQDNGGTVVKDSFIELLHSGTVALRAEYEGKGFTALLANGFSRKEKYLQALALGLPCLSGRWILDSVEGGEVIVDWQTYLLPAGESAALDGAVRSRVLPNVHPHDTRLVDMLQARPQPLAEMAVAAVIGSRKQVKERGEAYLFLLRALGAGSIAKFADVTAAREQILGSPSGAAATTTWLFVDDGAVSAAEAELSDGGGGGGGGKTTKRRKKEKNPTVSRQIEVAGFQLIRQSVILGKLYTRGRQLRLD